MSLPDSQEGLWSARYRDAGDDYLFGTAPNKFLASQAAHFGDGVSVLAVADGEGRNSVWLAEQGCTVTATEISPVALEKAAKLARGRHIMVDFVQVQRHLIQLRPALLPLRHHPVQERHEAVTVLALQQMRQLVHDDASGVRLKPVGARRCD